MIHELDNPIRLSFSALLVFGLLCSGCSPEGAKKFEYGVPVPNMRISVQLAGEEHIESLIPRFERLASEQGFPEYRGRPLEPGNLSGTTAIRSGQWFAPPGGRMHPYNISFQWGGLEPPRVSSFLVVISRGALADLQAEDWLMFQRWEKEILPKAFPAASFATVRHPAEFTLPEDMARISAETGMAIPENYRNTN